MYKCTIAYNCSEYLLRRLATMSSSFQLFLPRSLSEIMTTVSKESRGSLLLFLALVAVVEARTNKIKAHTHTAAAEVSKSSSKLFYYLRSVFSFWFSLLAISLQRQLFFVLRSSNLHFRISIWNSVSTMYLASQSLSASASRAASSVHGTPLLMNVVGGIKDVFSDIPRYN